MKGERRNWNISDFDTVRGIALTFPFTEESVSHEGTPSVKVRGKLMCRLHDSGQFIPIRLDFDLRDEYLERYPEFFHLPEHFVPYPYICMWIHCDNRSLLTEILELSWKGLASNTQVRDYEKQKSLT